MQTFYLYTNAFSGSIPTEFGRLEELQHTSMASCLTLGGTLPTQVGHLNKLREVLAGDTRVSGTLPAAWTSPGLSSQMQKLELGNARLSGSIPTGIRALSSLRTLGLTTNLFSGTIPTEIGAMTTINYLRLGETQLMSGTIPTQLGNMHGLAHLSILESPILTGTLPTSIGALNVTNLYLNSNALSGTVPSQMGALVALDYLYIHANRFSGTLPTQMAQIPGTHNCLLTTRQCEQGLGVGSCGADKCGGDWPSCHAYDSCLPCLFDCPLPHLSSTCAHLLEGKGGCHVAPSPPPPPPPPPLPPPSEVRKEVALWSSVGLVLLFCAVLLVHVFERQRRRARKWKLRSDEMEMKLIRDAGSRRELGQSRMDVWVAGAAAPVGLEQYLADAAGMLLTSRRASRGISTGGPQRGGVDPHSTRFASTISALISGQAVDAALGVVHFMNTSPALLRVGMARGVAEIEAEFAAFLAITKERSDPSADGAAAGGIGGEQSASNVWWDSVEVAEEAYECMRYCLFERAGSSSVSFPNSAYARDCDEHGVRPDRLAADGGGMRLADFAATREASLAKLELAHVAACRIYTTAAFKVINGPLRHAKAHEPHPLPVTVSFLGEAIRRLRAVSAIDATKANAKLDLWRGMRDLCVSESFLAAGGTEIAPMSTTSSLEVALAYAGAAAAATAATGPATACGKGESVLLFKLRTDSFMARGASIRFLSAFPGEDEILFPPLTFLQPTGRILRTHADSGGSSQPCEIVEVVPHFGSV